MKKFEKEGPGEICAVILAVNFPKKTPENPLLKGEILTSVIAKKFFGGNAKTELYFPHNCFVASRAPSAIDRNFAQAICG